MTSLSKSKILKTIDKELFCLEIEQYKSTTESTYLESVIHIAETKDLDFDLVVPLLNKQIIEMIRAEATQLNLIKKDAQLDF